MAEKTRVNYFTKILHLFLVLLVKIDRIIRGQKINIVNKNQLTLIQDLSGPIIFAPTHCGKLDIQVLTEVLWRFHWYLLSGDPYDLPGTVEGYWLKFNGVIYVDRDDKKSRNSAKQKMISLLKSGKNIMLYPEGTWNFSPNKLVLPLFRGIVDVAKAADATIVPFAMDIDDITNTYNVIIGNPITPLDKSLETLDVLRNAMANLKWNIIEQCSNGMVKYDKRRLFYVEKIYEEKRFSECKYMNPELIWKYARKENWEVEKEKISMDLAKIKPTIYNAFLFNKRLK